MQQRFRIKGVVYDADHPALQQALSQIYQSNEHPYCMCRPDGVRMYVAKYSAYVVKRLPDTGSQHHPSCPAYELPPGESGLGEVLGEAIVERGHDSVELRAAFPLARVNGRPVTRTGSGGHGDVQAARKALTLRGVTHWLWEQAGFNRWYPAMAGRRSWGVIRRFVLQQAAQAKIKGQPMSSVLYAPEPFSLQDKDAQAERRRDIFRALSSPESDIQFRMMIVLGQLASVQEALGGRRVLIKHMPDAPLLIDEPVWKRLQKTFAGVLQAQAADDALRILITALVYAKRDGVYQIDRASLMLATEAWIPVEDMSEVQLVRHLTTAGRSFIKPLAYESRSPAQYPNVKLLDTGGDGTPLDILNPLDDEKVRATKLKALRLRPPNSWVWDTSQAMPALPPQASYGAPDKHAAAAAPRPAGGDQDGASPPEAPPAAAGGLSIAEEARAA